MNGIHARGSFFSSIALFTYNFWLLYEYIVNGSGIYLVVDVFNNVMAKCDSSFNLVNVSHSNSHLKWRDTLVVMWTQIDSSWNGICTNGDICIYGVKLWNRVGNDVDYCNASSVQCRHSCPQRTIYRYLLSSWILCW